MLVSLFVGLKQQTISFLLDYPKLIGIWFVKGLLRKKAVGVDKVTKEEYGKNLDRNIEDLVQRLKNKSFKPLPSLRENE